MQGFGLLIAVIFVAVCTSAVTAVEITEEMKELIAMLHKTCVDESGVAEGLITDAAKGNFQEDPALKCYMKCIMIQGAGMDDDGVVDVESIIAMLPDGMEPEMPSAMRKCGTQSGADICDTAFKTNKCWYENAPNKYFLF